MRTDLLLGRFALLAPMIGIAAAASFALAHCGSSQKASSSGGDSSQAEQSFVTSVYPAVYPTCGTCHATGARGAPLFLTTTAEGSYTAIEGTPGLIASPDNSPLIQKGVHSGPALTASQNTVVSAWLKLESNSRNLADPGKPANLRAAFAAFGACMDYGEWMSLGLDGIATTTTDGGQCVSCHNAGQAANWLSADPADTFNHFAQFPYVQRLVVGTVTPLGAFDSITDSRRLIDKGTEAQQPQSNSHPRYSLSSTLSSNLSQFVADTISNMNANRCQNVAKPDAGADGG